MRVFINQGRASDEQYFPFQAVANSICTFLWRALVRPQRPNICPRRGRGEPEPLSHHFQYSSFPTPLPSHNWQETVVVIVPETQALRFADILSGRSQLWQAEEVCVPRNQHPVGPGYILGWVRTRNDQNRLQPGMIRLLLNHWGQIQVLVGDVDRQDAGGIQMAPIECERLSRKQMHRDGVTRKGIHCEHIELLRRLGR
jgi:hypothetical protein